MQLFPPRRGSISGDCFSFSFQVVDLLLLISNMQASSKCLINLIFHLFLDLLISSMGPLANFKLRVKLDFNSVYDRPFVDLVPVCQRPWEALNPILQHPPSMVHRSRGENSYSTNMASFSSGVCPFTSVLYWALPPPQLICCIKCFVVLYLLKSSMLKSDIFIIWYHQCASCFTKKRRWVSAPRGSQSRNRCKGDNDALI